LRTLRVARDARAEIDALLAWSEERFGPRTADRYRRLIEAGFDGLREDTDRGGVRRYDAFGLDLRIYPLRHCRTRLPPSERIGRPRHALVFTVEADIVTIHHVLDERSDLPARLRDMGSG
jgi:plasmid stabilization system protein ParE